MPTTATKRNTALDLIRAVAILLVIWQHASEFYYIGPNLTVLHAPCPSLAVINSLSRICVPLFVMLSGYLLLPIKTDTPTFFRRRFVRILAPWLFWCVAYAVYYVFYNGDSLAACLTHIASIPVNWGVQVGHLWYIYMLIGIYLLMPILSPWLRSCSKRELQGYLLLWGVTTLLPYLHDAGISVLGECTWNPSPLLHYYSGFVGYLLLGHYLRRYGVPGVWPSALLLIAGYAVTALAFTHWSYRTDSVVELEIPWDFCSTNVAAMTVAVFALLSRVKLSATGAVGRAITSISVYSFAMYLAHIMVLNTAHTLVSALPVCTDPAVGGPTVWVAVPLTALATFAVTYALVRLLNILPASRYWLGVD